MAWFHNNTGGRYMSAPPRVPTNAEDPLRALFESLRQDGQAPRDFGELGRLACVFHIDFSLFDELIHSGETVQIFDELESTVFPFDVFELDTSGAPEIPFADHGLMVAYRPRRYLIAVRYEAGRTVFVIADDLEMRTRDGGIERMVSAFQYGLKAAEDPEKDGTLERQPIRPLGVHTFDEKKIVSEERENTYWLRLLMAAIRFARLLNHRGAMIQRFQDPERPPTRQQRRAAGYVDRDHYRIKLRPRLSTEAAIGDVLSGRSLRYTPRRRHPVREFTRIYASGRSGPVRAHVRGGRLAPGVDYDARAVIRAAIENDPS
jgi:hypothetical protein